MQSDARTFDLRVRTIVTALLALGVLAVTAFEAINGNAVLEPFASWGGIIIGVYFGAHVSQNGAGIRARRDQQIAHEVAEAHAATATKPGEV